ncbi:MAG: hypothetical protein AB7O24_04805 [Kofleriaceae bacterium]
MEHDPDYEELADLDEPFNWCDRRCARCPLASECIIAVDETERRAEQIRAGVDPDATEVVEQDLIDRLDQGLELEIEAARQDGLDPDAILAQPPPAPSDVSQQRRAVVMKLVEAVHHGCLAATGDAARDAIESSVMIGMKVYALQDAAPPDVAGSFYVAANLMLLTRLDAELRSALDRIQIARAQREQIERLRSGLSLTLAPLWAAIPADVAEEIDDLIANQCAPSPFCTR